MRRAISTALVAIAATGATIEVATADALAMSAPIQITQNVNMRNGPNTSFARIGGIYAGQRPDFICWTTGENINGVDVWFDVNANGASGYYASYYDNSSYATDGLISSKYGIPSCGTQGPTVNPQGPTTVNPSGAGSSPTPSPDQRAGQRRALGFRAQWRGLRERGRASATRAGGR